MKVFERSIYPPGTSIHMPGAREHFGYSTPGGSRYKAQATANLSAQIEDTRDAFALKNERTSPEGSPKSSTSQSRPMLQRSRTQPSFQRQKTFPRLSQPNDGVEKHEDEHFTYFIPLTLQKESRDVLLKMPLSKLQKHNRISFPFSGEGTGFRAQGGATDLWPSGSYNPDQPTSYRDTFGRPGFHRQSPLNTAASSFFRG